MAILRKDAGTAFDPRVVEWFAAVVPAWLARVPAMATDADAAAAPAQLVPRRELGLDEVTGLPARQAFLRECARVLEARAADGRPTAVLLVTLDVAGPRVGRDRGLPSVEATVAVADALSRHTRGCDLVARYAQSEFVVLLPDVAAAEARAAATRVGEAANDALLDAGADERVSVQVAYGVAPAGCVAPEALLATADAMRRRVTAGAA
jgi:diguanylate cyclase (GGDEF)-like protein